MRTRILIAAIAASLAVLGAACGGDDGEDDAATTETTAVEQAIDEHNEADVEFVQMMIPHHRQAVEMADLAPERAEDIVEAQQAEITELDDFLAQAQ